MSLPPLHDLMHSALTCVLHKMQKEKMHDFEKQVEQLSEQVTMLMREKASLETRNSLLERVVQLKDEQQQHSEYGQEVTVLACSASYFC